MSQLRERSGKLMCVYGIKAIRRGNGPEEKNGLSLLRFSD